MVHKKTNYCILLIILIVILILIVSYKQDENFQYYTNQKCEGTSEYPASFNTTMNRTEAHNGKCYQIPKEWIYIGNETIVKNCPKNYVPSMYYIDQCVKPSAEQDLKGYEFPWKFGDSLDLSDAKKRCDKEYKLVGKCQKHGQMYYPPCNYFCASCKKCKKSKDANSEDCKNCKDCKDYKYDNAENILQCKRNPVTINRETKKITPVSDSTCPSEAKYKVSDDCSKCQDGGILHPKIDGLCIKDTPKNRKKYDIMETEYNVVLGTEACRKTGQVFLERQLTDEKGNYSFKNYCINETISL